ncbi:sensor histidine kinase [bacterium 1xD8-48]|nr:two-component sensor histidine kinase [Lachnospiraceae bacterium]MCI9327844.1 two-component sensor histidine kinase [Lachnospiraceae bacterium]NBJ99889.1 sensor histidine kinase [bacterium 1xD8-48]
MADKIKTILKKFKIWRSFKLRLLIIVFLMGIIPSIIMRVGILENYESRAVDVRISDVQTQLRIIANHLITYNYLQDTSSEVIGAELEQLSNLYNGRVLIINGNLKVVKDTYGISDGKTIVSEEVIRCIKGKNTVNYDSVNRFIEITMPIVETVTLPDDSGEGAREKELVRGVMLTSVSTDSIANTLDILNRRAIIMGNIMFIFIFALAMGLSRILVRPFERVTKAISEVKEGYTDEPISVSDYLETEHIVDAFNSLIKRMKVLDDSRQEFVANVSHELKTPITSIKVLADSLLAQEDVPAELYHEFMEDIAEEIERENKIINDLLALVKQDKSVAELNISMVVINELVEIILKRLRPIAKKSNVEVTLISKREIVAEVDEVKMSLILNNLVENAVKYNKEQGKVEVLLDADHQFFTVRVRDSGIGIPPEALGQIYERFYRVDKSHSKEIGGTGLGLAITRSAVQLLRGSIKVESVVGEGTAFTVKIPLTRTLV